MAYKRKWKIDTQPVPTSLSNPQAERVKPKLVWRVCPQCGEGFFEDSELVFEGILCRECRIDGYE